MINKIKDILNNYNIKKFDIINSTNKCFLNNKVKKIYVINLKTNITRRRYIKVLMNKYNINYSLIIVNKISKDINLLLNPIEYISKEELGCLLSHLWCLNDIIINKYENAIIFEDDIIFHKNFEHLFSNLFSNRYNFILLGACDFSFASTNKYNIKNNMYRIADNSKKIYGAHANYYSLEAAKIMFYLHIHQKNLSFFDKYYKNMFDYFPDSAYICYPNLVVSDISTTSLHHKYPFFSIEEQNYYNKCFIKFNFNDYHFIYLSLLNKNKNIKIENNDTYEIYITKILYSYFYSRDNINIIKNRLDFSFFTIEDIKMITDT
jgi:GR25 family glycosyltransferase involved in LPS biosynthesis